MYRKRILLGVYFAGIIIDPNKLTKHCGGKELNYYQEILALRSTKEIDLLQLNIQTSKLMVSARSFADLLCLECQVVSKFFSNRLLIAASLLCRS